MHFTEEQEKLLPEGCLKCQRYKSANSPFMIATGDKPCKILFVGETASDADERQCKPLVGRDGKLLRKAIENIGIDKYPMAFVNALICGTGKPTDKEISACRPFIEATIEEYDPVIIVTLGAPAMKSVLKMKGISKLHGTIYRAMHRTVVPIYGPSFVLRDTAYMKDWMEDFKAIKNLLDEACGETPKAEELKKRYTVIRTEEDAEAAFTEWEAAEYLYVDTEFEPLEFLDPSLIMLGLVITSKKRDGTLGHWFLPMEHPESPPGFYEKYKDRVRVLAETKPMGMHNAEADISVLHYRTGAALHKMVVFFDSMTGSMAIHGPGASHKLKNLAYTHADTGGYDQELEKWKIENPIKRGYSEIPLEILASPYACGDTDTTAQIVPKYMNRINKTGQSRFYYEVLKDSYLLNMEMRKNGLLMDWDQWEWRVNHFERAKVDVYKRIRDVPIIDEYAKIVEANKKRFTMKSPDQMKPMLFNLLGAEPSGRKTDSGDDSLDKVSLQMMRLQPGLSDDAKEAIDCLIEASQIQTIQSTFLKGYAEKVWGDSRLRPNWRNETESNRRNASKPNTQNIPAGRHVPWKGEKAENPYNMRMLITARPGYMLVVPDFAQLEFRLAACYSQDPNMIAGCRPKPDDAHTRVAKKHDIARDLGKIVNFLIIYGGSAGRLQMQFFKDAGVVKSWQFCQNVINDMMTEEYPLLFETISHYHDLIKKNKFVTTPILGHVRWLPQVDSPEDKIRAKALREGWNHVVQAMGHDLLEMCMQYILTQIIYPERLPWYFENDQHDGFVLEVPEDHVERAGKLCYEIMSDIPRKVLGDWQKVPLEVEVEYGKNLGNMKLLEV